MTKYFSIYRVRVQYGRGEMFSVFLVAANSPIKAKRLARMAAPLPAPMACIKCDSIAGVISAPEVKHPRVICTL